MTCDSTNVTAPVTNDPRVTYYYRYVTWALLIIDVINIMIQIQISRGVIGGHVSEKAFRCHSPPVPRTFSRSKCVMSTF